MSATAIELYDAQFWAEFGSWSNFVAYDLYMMYEESRGDLAFVPETMGCYACGGYDGITAPERQVVRLGAVVEERRDPTQTYVLACGHVTI